MNVETLQTAIVTEIGSYGAVALAILTASITLMVGIKLAKRVFMKSV